jgi:hypothetical protein
MHRRASALVLGLFAAAGAANGVSACTSDNGSQPPGDDSGTGPEAATTPDSGPATTGCVGPAPVMTVADTNGNQIAPDWSCYGPGDAGFLDLGDGSDDAADANDEGPPDASIADASDAAVVPDANPPPDAAPPPDAGVPDSGASTYALHLIDFSTSAPAVGATVNVMWGPLTNAPIAFTGTADGNGTLFYPAPPQGTFVLSYKVSGAGQFPLYWQSLPIISPPGQSESYTVLQTTYQVLTESILGSEKPNASLSALNTGARDCQGRDVQGAQFELIDGNTGKAVPSGTSVGSARVVYLYNNLPDALCTYTTNSPRAVWAMVNAPVNLGPGVPAHPYTLRFLGKRFEGEAPVVMAEYPVESYPGSITALRSGRYSPSLAH